RELRAAHARAERWRGGGHDRAEEIGLAFGEQRRGDETAHAVAEQEERLLGMLAAHDVEERLEVVEESREGVDVAAHPVGATVPALVIRVDRAVARREPGADVVVTAAVLREARDAREGASRRR